MSIKGEKVHISSSLRQKWRSDPASARSEEHTSELQSQSNLVCRLLLEKKKKKQSRASHAISPGVGMRQTRAAASGVTRAGPSRPMALARGTASRRTDSAARNGPAP